MCSRGRSKITLVALDGEQGTMIRDQIQMKELMKDHHDQYFRTVTWYENTIRDLHIQLDCTESNLDHSPEYDCSRSYHVDVFIDSNDDGIFDAAENRVHYRSPPHNELPQGTIDLQISIPPIDERNTKAGPHKTKIQMIRSEDYVNKCGKSDHNETREYTINIIPKVQDTGNRIPKLIVEIRSNL